MKRKFGLLFILLVGLCLQGSARADYYTRQFRDMDANRDHSITWNEYKSYFLYASRQAFKGVDENEDGKIDLGEWLRLKEREDPTYKKKAGFGCFRPCRGRAWWRYCPWDWDEYDCWAPYGPSYPRAYGLRFGVYIGR